MKKNLNLDSDLKALKLGQTFNWELSDLGQGLIGKRFSNLDFYLQQVLCRKYSLFLICGRRKNEKYILIPNILGEV